MDQRTDRLNEEGRLEDRSSTVPRDDDAAMMVVEAGEFRDSDSADSETERIKADIEDTRAEMGQTLNEIQERLSPEHLMGQVKETVREATIGKVERVMERVNETIGNVTEPAMEAMGRAGEKLKETGSSVTNVIRQNPIPCALIGLGLGMYFVKRARGGNGGTRRLETYGSSDRESGYGMATPRYAGVARQYGTSGEYKGGEYAGASRQYGMPNRRTLGRMKDSANELAHDTAERVSHLGHQAKEGVFWAGRGLQRMVNENPLAVGAAAVAVGAAVGLALPRTRVEHEYMGEASEKLVDKAQQVARDAMDKVKSATQGSPSEQARKPGQQQGQSQPGQPPQPGQQGQPSQQAQHGQRGQAGEPGQPSASQTGQSKTAQPGQPTPTA